jgi:hypothetical protein
MPMKAKAWAFSFCATLKGNNLLLFMVACDSDMKAEYQALLHELKIQTGSAG